MRASSTLTRSVGSLNLAAFMISSPSNIARRSFRFAYFWLVGFLGFPALTASASEYASTAVAEPDVVSWIRSHAQSLTTVEAGHDFADLEPLRAIIRDARVVALGEPTHGSREVFQLKHRIVEFLVAELGFTVFAIEANMPEARRVDDYVSGGRGAPADLIRGMKFWTWSTEEVRAMVEDLRKFNVDAANQHDGRHVEFAGFDMQDASVASVIVHDYFASRDVEFLPTVDAAVTALKPAARDSFGFSVDPRKERALQLWLGIEARIARSAAKISVATEATEVAWVAQCAHLVAQSLAMDATPPVFRDESMARNVEWLLARDPHAKVVLWAHNEHVKRSPGAMGGYLSQKLGAGLVVIGFATGHGAYRARASRDRALGAFPLQAPPADSIESALAATRIPLFLLDLQPSHGDSAAHWLFDDHPFRSVGGMEMAEQFKPASIAGNYDLLAWIEESSSSVPLPGGWPPAR